MLYVFYVTFYLWLLLNQSSFVTKQKLLQSSRLIGALRDLVPFVQIKKHSWRSVTFSKSLQLQLEVAPPPWAFLTFLTLYKWH